MSEANSEKENIMRLLLSGQEESIQLGLIIAESLQLEREIKQDIDIALNWFTRQMHSSIQGKLKAIHKVKNVNLSGQDLTSIPCQIQYVINLQSLDLSNNQLVRLPPKITNCTNLTILNLTGNPLLFLPPGMNELTKLVKLSFVGTRIAAPERERIRSALPNCETIFE
ncbi:leucine-rich repeat domain-containing protein [Xanthocytophaga agilis]|uniref:Leucine-rich repeat domain-containing protein n=1 Tax=Xanthocytophaga agilis TaxID=3048010 RepID=A0AAE3R2P8_9BACT|nr:leucine-rich repeat domain-containing protein [Xanthocytophaga agilis]MDJ1500517.1 leucine-rich repeat domain-containing protein [Xanthocytophaga agilis]